MPSAGADFGPHGGGLAVLAKYSAALLVAHDDVPTERMKSVPSPWARLLLFEQALFSDRHPAHRRIVQEWRGLLGCIGLARYLGLDLKVRPVDIANGSGAVRHLRSMAPVDQARELWDRFALLYIDGHLVGGTSPRTLVFTTIRRGQTGRAPFQREGRLIDPVAHYRAVRDRVALSLLAEWIRTTANELSGQTDKLRELLGHVPTGQSSEPIARTEPLLAQFDRWAEDARRALEELGGPVEHVVRGYTPSDLAAAFPTHHPAAAVFAHIRYAEAEEGIGNENDLAVEGASGIADPGRLGKLLKDGQPYSGDVLLPRGMTRRVENGRFVLPTSAADVAANWPDVSALFEEKLIPVTAVHPGAARGLSVGAAHFLLPFKTGVLQVVPAERLGSWTTATGDPATEVRVRLVLPLRSGLQLAYERVYSSSDIIRDDYVTTPLLTEWPDFEADGWTHYFYHVRQSTRMGTPLWFEPYPRESGSAYAEDSAGVRWGCSSTPPQAWLGSYGKHAGLLLPVRRPSVRPIGAAWDVSVDFGSTHTRVFRASTDASDRQTTEEVDLKLRTRAVLGDDNQLAFHFFGGQSPDGGSTAEPPSLVWLPLARTLQRQGTGEWLPCDGIMYWASLREPPSMDGLRGNLKWHRDDPQERAVFHSYVSHLYLSIAAEAAAQGARIKSLITAYPSVLPSELRHRHRQEWGEVARRFGVQLREPRSESSAIASYFIDRQGAAIAVNLLAIDIGGSTSDIAVWAKSRRAYSDSVRLAGDIMSRLVSTDPSARAAISRAVSRPPFNIQRIAWDATNGGRNGLIFNSLLRELSQNATFRKERDVLARNLYDGQGSPGEKLIAHLAYLFATTSFFLGMAVKKAGLTADRFDLRFAGRGSEYLHWLDALATGACRSLPATFFRAGAGLTVEEVQVTPPGAEVKQEVGRGLLVQTLEQQLEPDDRVTIVGEDGFSDASHELKWSDDLTFDVLRGLREPPAPRPLDSLTHLRAFVAAFQGDPAAKKAAQALGLKPASLDAGLRDRVHDQLFGPASAWNAMHSGGTQERLLEPFFITEAKALLEHLTGNHDLF